MERIALRKVSEAGYGALLGVERHLRTCGLDSALLELVKVRASQINACAFCIDMHWRAARAAGETEQRLYGLSAFRELAGYDDRERAALAWTEAVTTLDGHVPDEVYALARAHFTDQELVDLTIAIGMINLWNRLCIAMRTDVPETR